MNAISAMTVTLNGSSIGGMIMGLMLLSVLVFVIVNQFDTCLQQQNIVLPRWCVTTLVITVMLAFALRIVFPGEEVAAFARS